MHGDRCLPEKAQIQRLSLYQREGWHIILTKKKNIKSHINTKIQNQVAASSFT
jgi:hypothetical protein